MVGRAYPRRNDEVFYERFDGSLESAQKIANLTGLTVHVSVPPAKGFIPGDTVRLSHVRLNADQLVLGEIVVKSKDNPAAIHTEEQFAARFTKAGN